MKQAIYLYLLFKTADVKETHVDGMYKIECKVCHVDSTDTLKLTTYDLKHYNR